MFTECTEYVAALETDDSGYYQNLGMTTKVVMGMLAFCGLLSKGHQVYMDNYYNSPELFDELNLFDTYACGTVQINRKAVPKAFGKVKKLKQGDGIYRRRGNLLAVKYHDKRDIHMLSTIHTANIAETKNNVNRQTGQPILKPTTIIDYIKKMGGVDLSDQVVQYYDVLRKCVKWWKKLFFHLFNLMVVNSYMLYRKYGEEGRKKTHLEFRVSLINALFESAPDADSNRLSGAGKPGSPRWSSLS